MILGALVIPGFIVGIWVWVIGEIVVRAVFWIAKWLLILGVFVIAKLWGY